MDANDSFIAHDSAGARGDDLANSLLNFTTGPDDLDLQSAKRQKSARDPMSHRIIEKRRRDRMNNCLADLSRLIPTSYLKQGQGRIEKTEIIEMAIKHIKTLQAQVENSQNVGFNVTSMKQDIGTSVEGHMMDYSCCRERFYQGFKECQDETLRYFVEGEAMVASDPFCVRVMDHLSNAGQRFELSRGRGEEKKDTLMDVESQQAMSMSGTSSFSGSAAGSSLPTLEPMLPLLPTSGSMMPVSPVRNNQLRKLLSARALMQLEAEREASELHNQDAKGSSSNEGGSGLLKPTVPACTVTSMNTDTVVLSGMGGHCDNSMNGGGASSGYMSDASGMDKFSSGSIMSSGQGELMNPKDSSAVNVYKFKHNITKRFSQEGKAAAQQYDGSSSSSCKEAEDEAPSHHGSKHRSLKNKNRYASSTDSGPYPTSELSGAVRTSSPESIEAGQERSQERNVKCKAGDRSLGGSDFASMESESRSQSAVPLPGFVLHPSGTHYMPMSVCTGNIPDLFDSGAEAGLGAPVFHPISIPVHFRGPVISVPGSSVYSQNSTTVKSDGMASQPRDAKGTKKLQG